MGGQHIRRAHGPSPRPTKPASANPHWSPQGSTMTPWVHEGTARQRAGGSDSGAWHRVQTAPTAPRRALHTNGRGQPNPLRLGKGARPPEGRGYGQSFRTDATDSGEGREGVPGPVGSFSRELGTRRSSMGSP